jgi:hypothetical protein
MPAAPLGLEAEGFAEIDDTAGGMLRVLAAKSMRGCELEKVSGREGCRAGDGMQLEEI